MVGRIPVRAQAEVGHAQARQRGRPAAEPARSVPFVADEGLFEVADPAPPGPAADGPARSGTSAPLAVRMRPRTLAELFDGRSQLLVQHFMFAPGWSEGCKSCSFMADHLDGIEVPILFHFGGLASFYPSGLLSSLELSPSGFSTRYGRAQGGLVELTSRPARIDQWRVAGEVSLIDAQARAEGPGPLGGGWTMGVRRSYVDAVLAAVEAACAEALETPDITGLRVRDRLVMTEYNPYIMTSWYSREWSLGSESAALLG